MLNSREIFEDFKAQYKIRGLTDIQRAARFFILVKNSYGSSVRTYGCSKKDIKIMIEYLTQIQKRLTNVIIENKSYENVIEVYDRDDAVFYLDPPYYGTEKYYSAEFCPEDHVKLKERLSGIKGRFLLSYNDCLYIWDLYRDFNIEAINRNHNLIGRYAHMGKRYNELLIKNY